MPKKGENIYKRKDGRWEGRYVKSRICSGKIVYGYVYAKTYREVKAKLFEATASWNQQTTAAVTTSEFIFSKIASDWFENTKSQIKESTQNKYQNILNNYILPSYGKKALDCITHDFIESHCICLLESGGKNGGGLSPKTVTDVLSVIRNILKFAMRKGITIPCDGRAIQIKRTEKPLRIFSKNEQDKLCKFILENPEQCNIGILVCLFTGLRIGEICALRWEDVSFSEQAIYVHHTLQRIQNKSETGAKTKIVVTSPKSSCSIRTIPIPEELVNILISYKKTTTGYLLTNSEIEFVEPRTMENHFKKVLRLAEIESVNFHVTRHTFATRCIELGFDVKSLSEILGHSTVNITMNRYVHPTLDLKKENMKKLSSLLAVK